MSNIANALKLLNDPNLVWSDDFEQLRPFLIHFLNDEPKNRFAQIIAEVLTSE